MHTFIPINLTFNLILKGKQMSNPKIFYCSNDGYPKSARKGALAPSG